MSDAAFGHDCIDQFARSHIKDRVEGLSTRSSNPMAGELEQFTRVALFNLDGTAVGAGHIDCGPWCDHHYPCTKVAGSTGMGKGANLVGRVAIGADPVGPDDQPVRATGLKQAGTCTISDQAGVDAVFQQFPQGQSGTLQPGPGLGSVHRRDPVGGNTCADHAQGRAKTGSRQRSGIAVGQHSAAGLQQLCTQLTHVPVGRQVLGFDLDGALPERCLCGFEAACLGDQRRLLVQRPGQVDCRGSGRPQCLQFRCQLAAPVIPCDLQRRQPGAIGSGDADCWCATHYQIADGTDYVIRMGTDLLDLHLRKHPLVSQMQAAGGGIGAQRSNPVKTAQIKHLARSGEQKGAQSRTATRRRQADAGGALIFRLQSVQWRESTVFSAEDVQSIDAQLPVPLYHQLYTLLRQKIETGSCPRGSLLPGEAELTRQFAISRITARRALDELRRSGLVQRERGRGTTVTYQSPQAARRAPLTGLLDAHPDEERPGHLELLEFSRIAATPAIAELLKLPPGSAVDRSVHLLHLDGQPYARDLSFSLPVVGAAARADRPGSRLQLLRHRGIELAEIEQVISAATAEAAIARQLRTAVGAALISVTRTLYDLGGRAVEHITSLYRPDRFQFLSRLRLPRHGVR